MNSFRQKREYLADSHQLWIAYTRRFLVSLLAIAALLGSYWFFVRTELGQMIDTLGMFSLSSWNRHLPTWELFLLKTGYWYFLLPLLLLAALMVLWRRRWALGVRATIMVGFCCLLTQILKHVVFERPHLGITYYMSNSFPSGHTTCAVAAAVALVMVSNNRWRLLLTQLAALYTTLIGVAVIVARWHRPSDVWGAILLVVAGTLLLSPIEYADRDLKRPARRARWLRYSSRGGLLAMFLGVLGLVKYGYELQRLSGKIRLGQATEYLSQMATHNHPVSVGVAVSATLVTLGLIWFFLLEVAQLMRPRG